MIQIKIHNDGKEKCESFEAYLELPIVCEFGSTQEEALEKLRYKIGSLIDELNEMQFNNIVHVDCFGKPV